MDGLTIMEGILCIPLLLITLAGIILEPALTIEEYERQKTNTGRDQGNVLD